MPSENLWPADLEIPEPPPSPSLILREQAQYLRERTRDLVEGEVSTTTQGDMIVNRFYVRSPILDYRVQLFEIQHKLDAYPARVIWPQGFATPREAGGPAELEAALREVFGHETTRRTVGQLRAYAREQGLPYLLVEDEEIVGEAKTLARAVKKAYEVISEDSEVTIWHNGVMVHCVRNLGGVVSEHPTGPAAAR